MADNTSERRAPVQGYSPGIPWSLHIKAWDAYAAKYGRYQSAERMAERGGFHTNELDVFVPGWRDEVSEITRLQTENARLREEIARLQKKLAHTGGKEAWAERGVTVDPDLKGGEGGGEATWHPEKGKTYEAFKG